MMDQRLPYYMAHPIPFLYEDERVERRDFEYMKSMYPLSVKKILPFVEEECDRMSFAGSVIYDEYPDRLQIHLMCKRIYDKVKVQKSDDEMCEDEQIQDLIQILVFQELFRRRSQHRKHNRRFY